MLDRRAFIAGGIGFLAAWPALAQHAGQGPLFERLNQPGRIGLPDLAIQQRVFDSPAPKSENPGRWIARAELPLPRTEMAMAVERQGRMHLVGGYAEQRVDKPYHHVYDPAADRWSTAAELPRGANHVGVAELDGRLYAIGGFVEQNRRPHDECFVYGADGDRWSSMAPLPRASGAIACVALGGRVHAIGGAVGDSNESRRSVEWHRLYDPAADRWSELAPLPTGRDHVGIVAAEGRIHIVGGRVDTFYTSSNYHHSYDPQEDRWRLRNPLPTARSGHGTTVYRGQIFCVGGEGSNRVFGQTEAYDLKADRWFSYAPMLTPRHGMGAVTLGDSIYVAGGGPQMGGGVKSATHEAFTLS